MHVLDRCCLFYLHSTAACSLSYGARAAGVLCGLLPVAVVLERVCFGFCGRQGGNCVHEYSFRQMWQSLI
jgi:hypothetical protein